MLCQTFPETRSLAPEWIVGHREDYLEHGLKALESLSVRMLALRGFVEIVSERAFRHRGQMHAEDGRHPFGQQETRRGRRLRRGKQRARSKAEPLLLLIVLCSQSRLAILFVVRAW